MYIDVLRMTLRHAPLPRAVLLEHTHAPLEEGPAAGLRLLCERAVSADDAHCQREAAQASRGRQRSNASKQRACLRSSLVFAFSRLLA